MTFSIDDISFMQEALKEAVNIQDRVSPNPRVGAVIVKDNKIISKGAHEKFGGPHAEINAINIAEQSVEGATIYITLEPCSHSGKTPPCTEAIIKQKFKKVIFAMRDPNPKVTENDSIKQLNAANIQVEFGLLEKEAKKINQPFIKSFLLEAPYITGKWAMTLDGKINTHTGDSQWITDENTREHVHQVRALHDAILVGKNTFESDDPSLNCRYNIPSTQPYRIVLCSKFKEEYFSSKLASFKDNKSIFILKEKPTPEIEAKIKQEKMHYLLQEKELEDTFKKLNPYNISSIFIEGGSKLMGSILDKDLMDYAFTYISPKLVGGLGSSPIEGKGKEKMNEAVSLLNHELITFENDICLHGPIKHYE